MGFYECNKSSWAAWKQPPERVVLRHGFTCEYGFFWLDFSQDLRRAPRIFWLRHGLLAGNWRKLVILRVLKIMHKFRGASPTPMGGFLAFAQSACYPIAPSASLARMRVVRIFPASLWGSAVLSWLCRIVLCGMGWLHASPTTYLIDTWQTSEGLLHNAPTAVVQDADGYLWIGTNSGVCRFDGVRFVSFNGSAASENLRMLCLEFDRQGRLWAGTEQGVMLLEDGEWQRKFPEVPGPVWCMTHAPDAAIWFGTNGGVWRCEGVSAVQVEQGLQNPEIRSVLADADGSVWIVAREEVCRWRDGETSTVNFHTSGMGDRQFRKITKDLEGRPIVCGDGFLLRREGASWVNLNVGIPFPDLIYMDCLSARDGSLWVAVRNRGVFRLFDGVWTQIDGASGLSHDDVRSLAEDREGNLWICTNGGGINRLKYSQLGVFGVAAGLGRHVTTGLVCDAAGTIWAGTDGGGVKRLVGENFETAQFGGRATPRFIWSLCVARDQHLWIGTFSDGLVGWKDGRETRVHLADGLLDSWIPALCDGREGLWIGTHNGAVQRWSHGKLDTFRPLVSPPSSAIICMLEDRDGVLWVGTNGDGLLCLEHGEWRKFGKAEGLPDPVVTALHEDAHGRLWLGTAAHGIVLWESGLARNWSRESGLVSDSVSQIISDGGGNLWLGTDRGLQRVSIQELLDAPLGQGGKMSHSLLFSRSEGLPTPQFSSGHGGLATVAKDGSLWLSLAAGAVRVSPDSSSRPDFPLALKVESALLGGEMIWQDKEAKFAGPLRIASPAAPLELRFTAPSFKTPEKLRFRYRLVGLEDVWRDSEGRRFATFSSLPPGKFRFEVAAARPGEAWPELPESLEIVVRPRFWETAIFQVVMCLLGGLVIAILARWWALRRIRRRMSQLEEERKMDGERARIAQDLHDDLGTTLTEINFLGTLGAASANSPATRERLEGIVERAQRMAKSLDEIVWTVNPSNDSLSSTINYLCSRTQESLAAAGLRCRLEVSESIPDLTVDSELRHHLLMAVNEAVNNVMKHAKASECRLVAQFAGGRLFVSVVDDGCGFDPAAVPAGRNGLSNLRQRMTSAGGRIAIESGSGLGTRVLLEIPLSSQRFKSTVPPKRVVTRMAQSAFESKHACSSRHGKNHDC